MPSLEHEMFVDMVREQPSFVRELLRATLGEALPWDPAAPPYPESGELTPSVPVQYRADQVVLFRDPHQADVQNPNAGNVGAVILRFNVPGTKGSCSHGRRPSSHFGNRRSVLPA